LDGDVEQLLTTHFNVYVALRLAIAGKALADRHPQ